MATKQSEIRKTFFEYLFGEDRGYLCIGTINPKNREKKLTQHFFNWPDEKTKLLEHVEKNSTGLNVYFCTSLLDEKKRRKENCLPGRIVWADLDTCKPEHVDPYPSVVLQSSPSRYQAFWRLDQTVPPDIQEDYNRRIAYTFNANGVDPSGWDLTQLLRVPLTYNYNYDDPAEVLLLSATEAPVPSAIFERMEVDALKHELADDAFDQPLPGLDDLPSIDGIVYKYQLELNKTAFAALYTVTPSADENWSAILWRLISICIEVGMDNVEAFAVAHTSACNKYARDRRSPSHLWRDVLKCDVAHRRMLTSLGMTSILNMPTLVPTDAGSECFIDVYKEWAASATDAPTQYHELGAAIALSSILSDKIVIPTTHGKLIPNLWGLVLGDSSLARKTTSMTMATSIVTEIDEDLLLATDGSAEGLLTGISTRPHKVSLFYRDEVSGLFDQMNRKEYLAGLPETLTQLYDGQTAIRMLRKDVIRIQNPVFIFFGGGIRDKVYELVSEQYVLSGFLPRFLIVSGDADLSRMRLTGPPLAGDDRRDKIKDTLKELNDKYTKHTSILGGKTVIPVKHEAVLDPDAWEFFGQIETTMATAADDSGIKTLAIPTFIRLSFSLLKLGVLLAAARQAPSKSNTIKVTKQDLVNSSRYIQGWGRYSVDMLHNAGRTASERTLQKVLMAVKHKPGITKSELMQNYKLWARDMDSIIETLLQRGDITKKQQRGLTLWPT